MDNTSVPQPLRDTSVPIGLAAIHLSPVLRSKPFRRGEDLTGTTNPAVRRRLQNRINQRACRIRKSRNESRVEKTRQVDDGSGHATQVMPYSTPTESHNTPMDFLNIVQIPNMIPLPGSPDKVSDPTEGSTSSNTTLAISVRNTSDLYITRSSYRAIMLARDFNNWLAHYKKRNVIPLSSDHLLTLMCFNVIRAHAMNTSILGLGPDEMAEDDILSPFSANSPLASKLPKALPPSFKPTLLQKTIPHHPEADMLPWAQVRDNMILFQGTYDDEEFCEDMMGMRCSWDAESAGSKQGNLKTVEVEGPKNEPGLIVWNDPWRPESWEVSEAFLRKWGWLFVGCRELLESTNRWREKRGEERLVW